MRNLIILFILIVGLFATSCSKDTLKYDFSKTNSKAEIDTLLSKIAKDNKDVSVDNAYGLNEISVKGMHYDGVPIKTALISDYYVLLTTDTTAFSAKKLLEAIESKKGLTKKLDSYSKAIEFEWNTETEKAKLEITLKNGKNLAELGSKDYGELTIRYNPVYNNRLANIHNDIKAYEKEPIYELKIDAYGCAYDVIVNDVILDESSTENEFLLNGVITQQESSIQLIVKPLSDSNGATSKIFIDQSYFSAAVIDYGTGETVATIDRTMVKGNSPVPFTLDFNAALPYYPEAWTNGDDLSNDVNLKDKVIAFYDKLGKALLEKDEKAISDSFYQYHFETQQLNYDTNFETGKDKWEALVSVQDMSYKYTVANDFRIEYNAGGKLIYTYPKDKTDMLIFTGKGYDYTMNFFLYQPKGSNELKLIR